MTINHRRLTILAVLVMTSVSLARGLIGSDVTFGIALGWILCACVIYVSIEKKP